MRRILITAMFLISGSFAYADDYHHQGKPVYKVTITNITKANQFTPILTATHKRSISFFELGEPASAGLASMAEGGDVSVLAQELSDTGKVIDTANSADVLGPPPLLGAGESVTLHIEGDRRFRSRLSMAAMILPTNDSFVALDSVRLPRNGSKTFFARGYDAGSEPNDEWCVNIPGPTCGGTGASPATDGEGFVHVANGVQGIGDLPPETYDWRNPIARVVIKRVR